MSVTLMVQIEKIYPDVVIPSYKHEGDSGMDIRAYFSEEFKEKAKQGNGYYNENKNILFIQPNTRYLIPTGIKVGITDSNYEIQVRPRSGLALKAGLTVLNTPGTIDAGYRGEIGVILYNSNSSQQCGVSHGDRIAQLVLTPILKAEWHIVDSVDETKRGDGGFGSTGVA